MGRRHQAQVHRGSNKHSGCIGSEMRNSLFHFHNVLKSEAKVIFLFHPTLRCIGGLRYFLNVPTIKMKNEVGYFYYLTSLFKCTSDLSGISAPLANKTGFVIMTVSAATYFTRRIGICLFVVTIECSTLFSRVQTCSVARRACFLFSCL